MQYLLTTARCAAAGAAAVVAGGCWASNVSTNPPAARRLATHPENENLGALNITLSRANHTRRIPPRSTLIESWNLVNNGLAIVCHRARCSSQREALQRRQLNGNCQTLYPKR